MAAQPCLERGAADDMQMTGKLFGKCPVQTLETPEYVLEEGPGENGSGWLKESDAGIRNCGLEGNLVVLKLLITRDCNFPESILYSRIRARCGQGTSVSAWMIRTVSTDKPRIECNFEEGVWFGKEGSWWNLLPEHSSGFQITPPTAVSTRSVLQGHSYFSYDVMEFQGPNI